MRFDRRISRRSFLAAAGVSAAALALTACGGSSSTAASTAASTGASSAAGTAAGGTLNIMLETEVQSLDPQIATDGTSFEVIADYTDGLMQMDADGAAVPALAETYDISEDGKTYTFHLARGFLLLYHRGLSHPPFWRVFLFCLRCLFRFRGVVHYALGVEQVLDLAAQRLCHLPKLVHVRAFTLSAAPAFHCAVAHARPAAKFPAAYPCGLAALVYGVIGVCFSHAAVLLLHKYTANAVKMEV